MNLETKFDVDDDKGDDDCLAEDREEAGGDTSILREQDRFLPIANVAKVMKKSVPKSGKIAKDAKECVQECVSEFISFVTSEASERCATEKRKTINGEDILVALKQLGFDNYFEPLKSFLTKYREMNQGCRGEQKVSGLPDGPLLDLVVEDDSFNDPLSIISNVDRIGRPPIVYTNSTNFSGSQ